MKRCSSCHRRKPRRGQRTCRECHTAYVRRWRRSQVKWLRLFVEASRQAVQDASLDAVRRVLERYDERASGRDKAFVGLVRRHLARTADRDSLS